MIRINPTLSISSIPFLAPNGTISVPSYSFSNDPDTGMLLRTANATIDFALDGVTAVRFQKSNTTVSIGSYALTFAAGSPETNAPDTFINRGAAGAVLITNDGSTTGTATLGKAAVGLKGIYLDYTNTATVGNVTINKASGRVNIAASGTTFTVTNSLVTAASHIFLTFAGNPGNSVVLYAVAAAGSFTVNTSAAITNQTAIDFLVFNAD